MKLLLTLIYFTFSLQTFALATIPPESNVKIKNKIFSFYANKELLKTHVGVEHAVITIHGSARNPDTYFKSVWAVSKKLNKEKSSIIISPHFKISGDVMLKNEMKFTYEGWWIGNQSIAGGNISSFSVIDFFIKTLSNQTLYPNLKTLVITGHSAGGHLTQRLALGSRADLARDAHPLDIKYVVANPGTYAYLSAKRPVAGQGGIFEIPRSTRCAYNNYKYGMNKRNRYMSRDSVSIMTARFIKRNVVYFLGENDTGEVEQTCQAALQGPHRLARGRNFKAHVDEEFPANLHSLITVPAIGHTQYGMYTSDIGNKVLFE